MCRLPYHRPQFRLIATCLGFLSIIISSTNAIPVSPNNVLVARESTLYNMVAMQPGSPLHWRHLVAIAGTIVIETASPPADPLAAIIFNGTSAVVSEAMYR